MHLYYKKVCVISFYLAADKLSHAVWNFESCWYQQPYFIYKVKIINPKRKSDAIVRQLHSIHSKFAAANGMQVKSIEVLE